MSKFLDYANHINAPQPILDWIEKRMDDKIDTSEGEHVIDYLVAENPKIKTANYEDTKHNAEKWIAIQIKKGEHIKETVEDTEIVLDFKDGFKIVQLIGKNAYEREGYLMRHCVASYFGKSVKIYSLRDKDNMPHCTIEQDQQVKGKGNGDIHPNYVGYVVKFLEHIGMTVGDSEMLHLGYVNIEKLLPDIGNKKDLEKEIYNKKYFLKNKKELLKNKKGEQLINLDVLGVFPLVEDNKDTIKIAFDIPLLVSASIEWIRSKSKKILKKEQVEAGGYNSKLAGGDYSQLAGGNHSQLAGGYYSKLALKENGIAVGDHNSQAKGKMGSLIVLVEREKNSPYKIISYSAGVIDGKKLKEDTWYKNEGGKFVEVKE